MKTQGPILLLLILFATFCGVTGAQAATYTLTITANHGSVKVTPDKALYNEGEIVELIPRPETGYCFTGWLGNAHGKRLVLNLKMDSDKAITANFGTWQPPIGIPKPEFGIEESYRMYDNPANRNPNLTYTQNSEGGYYTHYVDNTDPNATDTGNPYGTAEKPRKSIPSNLPLGSVVEVYSEPSNYGPSGEVLISGEGTKERPIFIRGIGNPRIEREVAIGYYGNASYIIVEGISSFSGSISGRIEGISFTASHIAFRNCDFHGDENGGAFVISSWTSNNVENIVLYNNVIHDNGVWDPNVAQGDRDIGGIKVGAKVSYLWVLDNEMYHNECNGIQINGGSVTHHIYVGRNIAHHNKQSGFWTKSAEDLIFSENIAYGHRASSSDPFGAGMGFQYDPKRVWFLFNTIYDNTMGIVCGSGNVGGREEFYFIGNVIYNVTNGFSLNGLNTPEPAKLIGNTIYNSENGIANGYYTSKLDIINNVIADYDDAISFGSEYQTYLISNMSYNLLDGSGDIRWGSTYADLSQFQQVTGKGAGCIEADPLFTDAANDDFHLGTTSPAINAGTSSGVVQEVFDRFEQLYGIDIRKDIEGRTRPQGSAWDMGAYEYVLSPITGLAVSGASQNSVTFGWTVPGEEGVTGTPTRYDVRYAGSPLTEANWDAATQVQGEPVPGDFGEQQSFTITGLNPGTTYYVAIKTADDGGHTSQLSNVASGTTATSGNHAPVLALIGDRSVVETQELTFVVSATDADGDVLAYSATNLPMGAGFTPATRTFTWISTNTQSGTYRVTFQVTDGQVAVSETVKITVRETPNQSPVLEAVGDKIVNENASLSFSIKAADPDGDALTYSAMGLPSGATFANQVFSWIPSYDQAGSYLVTFSVSDGELTDDEKITITVVNVTDMTAPSAHDFYPLPDSIQAPLNCLISFTISDGGWGVDGNTVTLHVNDQLVYSGDKTVYESAYGVCRRTGTRASYRYYYHPINIFNFDQQVSVRVNASDIAHNAMTPVSYQFKTEMRSFGQNKKVASGSDILAKGSPLTVADSAGNIWVTWESGTAGSRDIYVGKLTSGADNFDSSIRLTESSFDQCNSAIAVGSDDKLYVVWQDNRRGNWDIYASVSADGIAWSTGTLVVDSNNNEVNPAIAVDKSSPNRAYVVWQDDRNGNQDIYIAASSNSFLTAAVSQITSNSSDQIEPAIAVGPSNAVYVIWTDNRGGSSDIYGAVSNYGSWTNVPIVNNASNQTKPAIAVESAEAKLHILWVDGRSGNQDIYYATSDGLPGSPLSGSSIIDDTSAAKQSEPVIITNGSSKVFACWQDERNVAANGGDTDLYMAELTSDSRTNILVGDDGTNSNQSEPAIGVGEYGHPYLVWAYGRSANTEIYYAASTFVEPIALKTKDVLASLGATVGTDPASITSVNDVSVVVPAGACLCDMKIAISKMKNPQAFTFAKQCLGGYDFGPSGMQFSQPVTVTIPYTPSGSGTSVSAYWYNSLTGAISQQGISGVQDIVISPTLHALQFKTTHFTPFYLLLAGGREGGGGGGCSMSVCGEGDIDIVGFLLPYVGLAVVMLVLKLRDRRNRKVRSIT